MSVTNPAVLVGYIETSGRALDLASRMLQKQASDAELLKSASVSLVRKLRELQLIDAGQEKLAADELGNHAATLGILSSVLDKFQKLAKDRADLQKRSREEAPDLGAPARSSGRRSDRGPSLGEQADAALMRLIRR